MSITPPATCFLALLFIPVVAACGQEKIRDYETARTIFWSQLYASGGETLYCGDHFAPGDHRGLNVEHVFPMSWVARSLGCGRRKECREKSARFNQIEADLHNLYPARRDVNDARRSFRFGMIPGEARQFGTCDFEVDERQRVAEPRPVSRGEIARAMLYMQKEYGLVIFRRQLEMLIDWHRADPPSEHERWRNETIARLQGNRNPFIDHPELADRIQAH